MDWVQLAWFFAVAIMAVSWILIPAIKDLVKLVRHD